MAEEEKLAGDVYSALNEVWNLRVFDNIAGRSRPTKQQWRCFWKDTPWPFQPIRRESSPMKACRASTMICSAGGGLSVEEALRVGAAIEEMDILDLQERMAQTDKEDILLVYSNLKRGSENHLRAFVNNLERRGVQYSPVHLSQEEYDRIIEG